MAAIGDRYDLQQVLDVVYESAMKSWAGEFAQEIVDKTRAELLERGLFVEFDGPNEPPSFKALADKNKAEGGCGCAPGTILCPH